TGCGESACQCDGTGKYCFPVLVKHGYISLYTTSKYNTSVYTMFLLMINEVNDWSLNISHDAITYFKVYFVSIFFNCLSESIVGV
ncbi:hypothetical protein ACLD3R_21360, partial [Salmonella sp. 741265076_HSA]|uniref:hypothetical protein n=1 Tax=Salmonella sp. 741265076_HSA TaxID=3389001 RepID=UPI0039805F34